MNKVIHIVFGDSSAAILSNYLKYRDNQNSEIKRFREDFSYGPIFKMETEDGIADRGKWFDYMSKNDLCKHYDNCERIIIDTHKEIRGIPEGSKVIIWHGNNCSDQIGLRYLSYMLKSEKIVEIDLKKSFTSKDKNDLDCSLTLGFCETSDIRELIGMKTKMSALRRNHLIEEWKVISESKNLLRILEGDKLINVSEDYYDKALIGNCTCDYQPAGSVIGKTMSESKQFVGDHYLCYRMKRLIDTKVIDYRGNPNYMLELEVRITSNLSTI